MTALVLIQCEDGRPVNGALAGVKAAQSLGSCIALVCGSGAQQAANEIAALANIERVLALESANAPRAETIVPFLIELRARLNCTHIIAAAGAWSRGVLPRIAGLLDVMAVTEVVSIVDPNTYVRPVHAGAALMTLRVDSAVHVVTVRSSAFDAPLQGDASAPDRSPSAAGAGAQERPPVEVVAFESKNERSAAFVERNQSQQDGMVELIGARVVVSGGRGVGSAEGFERIRPLAHALNAAVGASRAAVDSGFAPADSQVGQTGKSVAPELYIALGISGAVQHWAGMKDSKVIVAINKDPDAPIFQFADYGLVADLFEVLPQLQQSIAALPPRP